MWRGEEEQNRGDAGIASRWEQVPGQLVIVTSFGVELSIGPAVHSNAYSTATEHASLAIASFPCCLRLCSVSNDASHAGHECKPREETLDGAVVDDRERFDDCDAISSSSSDNLRFSDDGSVGSESVALIWAEKFSRHARMRFMRRE